MKVELKRTNITTSIVKQSLMGSYSLYYNWKGYDILGWCKFVGKSSLRYILLYKEKSNQIIKLPFVVNPKDHISLYKEGVQKQAPDGVGWVFPHLYHIKLYWSDFRNQSVIKQQNEESDEEIERMFENIKIFLAEVYEKGQIYL